jgi:predicted nucleotidyltransferase
MVDTRTARQIAQNFIFDLRSLGYNPSKAYLFGSVVNGNTHKYSDIDLAVWDSRFTGILHLDYEAVSKLLLKYEQIELHTFSDNYTNPFSDLVINTGQKIEI